MSATDPRRYQPCVEDWDEEADSPLPIPRSSANVAVKRDLSSDFDPVSPIIRYADDGTDSGYASQAPTVSSRASMASHHRREPDLKSEINIVERERKPYAMTTKEGERTSMKVKSADVKDSKPKKPFCHKPSDGCWVCDKYQYHFDPATLPKKEAKKPTPAPAPQPQPQPKKEVSRPKVEELPKMTRRMSSNQSRPSSMYANTPVQPTFTHYAVPPPAWPTSTPPPLQQPIPPQYSYYVPSGPPVYNVAPPPQQPSYFYGPQPVLEDYSQQYALPKPPRRTSMIVAERPRLDTRPSRTQTMMERPIALDQRPQIMTKRSTRDIEADRVAMPPPPKPQHATVNSSRPKQNRSNTYHSTNSSNRNSYYEDDSDEEYMVDPRSNAYQEPPSPSRPPSSYRKLVAQQEAERARASREVVERPRLQEKAASYQHGTKNVQIAATRGVPRRRTTESVPPPPRTIEQEVAEAEAYIRKRGSFPVNDLTAENLKNLKTVATRQVSDQRSDTGSTGSHLTHHSSSKDSSNGRGRGVSNGSTLGNAPKTSMNITYNGMNLNITEDGSLSEGPPVRIDLGAFQLHMNGNNRDKENIDYRVKPQKQLERVPSMSSNPSRRSLTSGGHLPVTLQRREEQLAIEAPAPHDPRLGYSRRMSYVDDDEREILRRSAKSSKQASRNTSASRQPQYEDLPVRQKPNRSSVDYSIRREDTSVM